MSLLHGTVGEHATKPRNIASFWRNKFAANKARDQVVTYTLRRAGWRVLRIWEHELAPKNAGRLATRIRRIDQMTIMP